MLALSEQRPHDTHLAWRYSNRRLRFTWALGAITGDDHLATGGSFRPVWLSTAAVAVTALVLRPAATAIGPVLDELTTELNMGPTLAGVLTALPGLCFALMGLLTRRLVAKTGPVGAMVVASAAIIIGTIVRAFVGSWLPFLFFTLCALGGMAIGNVVAPAFIRLAFPSSAARMATVYTTSLAVGAILPTLFADPLVRIGGWRLAVGVWAVIAVVAIVLWMLVWRRWGATAPIRRGPARVKASALFRSPTAVALMLFFGLQSTQAYIQFGWLAQIYRSGGVSAGTASLMVALISAGGIPGGLLMPRLVQRPRVLTGAVVLFSSLLAVGYIGLALSPSTMPGLWAVALSISGFCFPTALALIIERTRDPEVTAAVSAFVQPYGYLLAAAGPFLVGFFYEVVGSWPPILWALAAFAVPMCVAGLVSARPKLIDHSLSIDD